MLILSPAADVAASSLEYVSGSGYVFVRSTNAAGLQLGFGVDDVDGIGMWSSYQRLGGRTVLGVAIAGRYACELSVCQAFERAVLRWNPLLVQAEPVDVLDELSPQSELRLQSVVQLPDPDPQASSGGEGLYDTTDGLAATRDALGPARQLVVGSPVVVQGFGSRTVLRGTRGVLLDPGMGGSVSILGAGQLAQAAGLIPAAALVPQIVPPSAAREPVRLVVPRLGLDAAIESVVPATDGSLPPPSQPESVAWYTDSALAGEGGTTLLAGHVDWVGHRAAFRDLDTLGLGDDLLLVDSNGTSVQYRVVATGLYAQDSAALRHFMVNPGWGTPTLTLVTCDGLFDLASRTYLDRLVVRAELAYPGL